MSNWSQTQWVRGIILAVGSLLSLLILGFTSIEKGMVALTITTTLVGLVGMADSGLIKPNNLIKSLNKIDLTIDQVVVDKAKINGSVKPE
jgi:hypothetical protein